MNAFLKFVRETSLMLAEKGLTSRIAGESHGGLDSSSGIKNAKSNLLRRTQTMNACFSSNGLAALIAQVFYRVLLPRCWLFYTPRVKYTKFPQITSDLPRSLFKWLPEKGAYLLKLRIFARFVAPIATDHHVKLNLQTHDLRLQCPPTHLVSLSCNP
jgi:hypothetical protein